MSPTVPQDELGAGVIADLVDRLRDIAELLQFEMPAAEEIEHALVLELGSLRCREAAAVIAVLAAQARLAGDRRLDTAQAPLPARATLTIQHRRIAVSVLRRPVAGHAGCYPTRYSCSRYLPLVFG